ncbi:MAG: hypothetical protein ACOC41_08940 [Chitinivibrionales bacterium]
MKKIVTVCILFFTALCVLCTENPSEPKDESQQGNGSNSEAQQGIVDFISVDGVTLFETTASEIEDVLGTPRDVNQSGGYSYYYYPDKGLKFTLDRRDIVVSVNVYSSNWQYQLGDDPVRYARYAFQTAEGISVGSDVVTMDSVVSRYGEPSARGNTSSQATAETPWFFQYTDQLEERTGVMWFCFFGEDTTDYTGKPVTMIKMY